MKDLLKNTGELENNNKLQDKQLLSYFIANCL